MVKMHQNTFGGRAAAGA